MTHKLDEHGKTMKAPTFGGAIHFDSLALTEEGLAVVRNILCILALEHPELEYCPFIPTVVALILHHASPDETLGCMRVMIRKSGMTDWVYFPLNLASCMAFYTAFGELLRKNVPKVCKHLSLLDKSKDVRGFWIKWLNNFLLDILSLDAAFRLMDSFILEGYKIIYRYGIGALILRGPIVLKCNNIQDVMRVYEEQPFSARNEDDDKLAKAAYNFSFSRSHVTKISAEHLANNENHEMVACDPTAELRLMPKLLSKSAFLQDQHWHYVYSWIPKHKKPYDVDILFSTEEHGYNLDTLYAKCDDNEPLLIFVQTTDGKIFGSYISECFRGNLSTGRFFGTAETFLFTLEPKQEKFEWVGLSVRPEDPDKMSDVAVNSSYFIFGNNKYLAVGGGGVNYGFSLDEKLEKGTSGTCTSFNNPSLVGDKNTFEIRIVEIWIFK